MITDTDSLNTLDLGDYYAILPSVSFIYSSKDFIDHHNGEKVPMGFRYSSGNNSEWETIDSIWKKIIQNIDPNFNWK